MAYTYGLTGIKQVDSQAAVGPSGAAIRVFDIALGTTAMAGQCALYHGTSTAGVNWITLNSANSYFNSNAGIRFPNGCYAYATGATAIVNFIVEL